MLLTVHLPCVGHDVGIISFRGTSNIHNLNTDLRSLMVPLASPCMLSLAERESIENVRVHRGFQAAFMAIREALLLHAQEFELNCVWCIGHSLGGALATFMAADLYLGASRKFQVGLCTFASPRVGNAAFAQLVHFAVDASVRVVFANDPIARSPPQLCGSMGVGCCPTWQYKHVSGLVRVFKNGHLVVLPSFLEEFLRSVIRRFLLRSFFYCCVWLYRAPGHRLYSCLGALRVVRELENIGSVRHPSQDPALDHHDVLGIQFT